MKTCTSCKVEKNETEFFRKRNGFEGFCKECKSSKRKKLWIKNPEKYKELARQSAKKARETNPEKYREYRDRWNRENRARVTVQARERAKERVESYKATVKRWREKNKDKIHESVKNSIKRNPEKTLSRKLFHYYLKNETLVRNPKCEMCMMECRTEAHHEDYAYPLQVKWVCKPCHGKIHRKYK